MTKVAKKQVKCARCGAESEQLIVCSVNFLLGTKEQNEALMKSQQRCPKCGYEAPDISVIEEDTQENF